VYKRIRINCKCSEAKRSEFELRADVCGCSGGAAQDQPYHLLFEALLCLGPQPTGRLHQFWMSRQCCHLPTGIHFILQLSVLHHYHFESNIQTIFDRNLDTLHKSDRIWVGNNYLHESSTILLEVLTVAKLE